MSKSIRIAALLAVASVPLGAVMPALAAESSGGMPQLAFDNPWTIAQIVWMLVIFGLLYHISARYALPQVAEILEVRRQRIDGDLEAAHAAKERADRAMAEHLAATAKARAEAQAAIATAAQAAQAEAAQRSAELNARLNAQIAAAEQRIDTARAAAMGALRQVATETTDVLLQRLIGHADRAVVEQAVGRELTARGRA